MQVIDEDGRVFGVINVIDLLVVLFIVAVVAAGVALLVGSGSDNGTGGPSDDSETATLTVRAESVQPYVAAALSTGPVEGTNITRIENVSVQPATVYTENESSAVLARDHPRLKTVEIEVTARVTEGPNGLVFSGRPLRIGQPVDIDAGTVAFSGDVTAIERDSER